MRQFPTAKLLVLTTASSPSFRPMLTYSLPQRADGFGRCELPPAHARTHTRAHTHTHTHTHTYIPPPTTGSGHTRFVKLAAPPKHQIDSWELKRENVELLGVLGAGNFGEVRQGLLGGRDVAIKTAKVRNATQLNATPCTCYAPAQSMRASSICSDQRVLVGSTS
jgi:hypothetical protein